MTIADILTIIGEYNIPFNAKLKLYSCLAGDAVKIGCAYYNKSTNTIVLVQDCIGYCHPYHESPDWIALV